MSSISLCATKLTSNLWKWLTFFIQECPCELQWKYLDFLFEVVVMGVPRKGSGRAMEGLGVWTSTAWGLETTNSNKSDVNYFQILIFFKKWFSADLLAGEDCGVAPVPNQTSSILSRTLLIKPALDITFSLAERLVMVDSGCGLETRV